jgi:hypothetical protein
MSLGCGYAFQGGRCDDGSNPTDCVYDSPTSSGMEKCSGTLQFVRIPSKYECKDQRNKLKCIKVRCHCFSNIFTNFVFKTTEQVRKFGGMQEIVSRSLQRNQLHSTFLKGLMRKNIFYWNYIITLKKFKVE